MGMTADQYQEMLSALLPTGLAWPRNPDSVIGQLMAAFAQEFSRFDQRCDDFLNELFPASLVELLPDWERVLGLPDDCTPVDSLTFLERRFEVVQTLTSMGGQSAPYFIALAASMGYQITVSTFAPYDCEMACESSVLDEIWRFAWQVNSALNSINDETCELDCEMPLQVWGNARLECAISSLKPAESVVLFSYQ